MLVSLFKKWFPIEVFVSESFVQVVYLPMSISNRAYTKVHNFSNFVNYDTICRTYKIQMLFSRISGMQFNFIFCCIQRNERNALLYHNEFLQCIPKEKKNHNFSNKNLKLFFELQYVRGTYSTISLYFRPVCKH